MNPWNVTIKMYGHSKAFIVIALSLRTIWAKKKTESLMELKFSLHLNHKKYNIKPNDLRNTHC